MKRLMQKEQLTFPNPTLLPAWLPNSLNCRAKWARNMLSSTVKRRTLQRPFSNSTCQDLPAISSRRNPSAVFFPWLTSSTTSLLHSSAASFRQAPRIRLLGISGKASEKRSNSSRVKRKPRKQLWARSKNSSARESKPSCSMKALLTISLTQSSQARSTTSKLSS